MPEIRNYKAIVRTEVRLFVDERDVGGFEVISRTEQHATADDLATPLLHGVSDARKQAERHIAAMVDNERERSR